ncbi:molybdate ABC transporter substrate-binding protein [Vibrio sp. TBV020]|uniref:molybdate ABC transporter substrate-binding protein n=1 Tax=Vibrio sp. TBV020 TaxID=3137398 RepID=UPI0038CDC9FC
MSVIAQDKLRIYAASSMTNAVDEMVEIFEQSHRVKVTTVYGGTSSLARQVEQGAPVDVFIAANKKWMNYLVSKNVVLGDNVTNIATNELVVVSTSKLTLDVNSASSWLDVLKGQRIAIGQPNAVPAGIYAQESLESLNVWNDLKGHLAPTKNVRIALALVERNETPIGIVYKTDAALTDRVQVVARLPRASHQAIVYPIAAMNTHSATTQFIQFVRSSEGQAILGKYGFNQGL